MSLRCPAGYREFRYTEQEWILLAARLRTESHPDCQLIAAQIRVQLAAPRPPRKRDQNLRIRFQDAQARTLRTFAKSMGILSQ